jgi:hypothetical protein
VSNRIIGTPVLVGYLAVFWGGVSALLIFLSTNSPPGAPELKWKEAEIFTTTKLDVEIEKDSVDPDGDSIHYLYQWKRNGEIVAGKDSRQVSDKELTVGETWEVIVTPNDGTFGGSGCGLPWRECSAFGVGSATLSVTIADSPPRARVRFFTAEGRETSQLPGGVDLEAKLSCMDPDTEKERARAAEKAADAGTPLPPRDPNEPDPCTYDVYWIPADTVLAEGTEPPARGPKLPAALAKPGTAWKVVATASSSGLTGQASEAKLRVL